MIPSAATSALLPHAHLHVPESRLGPLKVLQSPLRRRQGLAGIPLTQLFLRRQHLGRRCRKLLHDLDETGIGLHHSAILDAPHDGLDALTQPALRQRQCRHVLAVFHIGILVAIPHHLERGRHDLSLLLGKLSVESVITAPATTAAALLGLAVISAKRPDFHEVDVGRGGLPSAHPVVVGRLGVVRHEITGLEIHFFEIERVGRRHLGRAAGPGIQIEGILRTAVDGIHQLHASQTVVVFGLHLDKRLFNRRDLDVAPRRLEPNRRWLIGEGVDHVIRRPDHHAPVKGIEDDAV